MFCIARSRIRSETRHNALYCSCSIFIPLFLKPVTFSLCSYITSEQHPFWTAPNYRGDVLSPHKRSIAFYISFVHSNFILRISNRSNILAFSEYSFPKRVFLLTFINRYIPHRQHFSSQRFTFDCWYIWPTSVANKNLYICTSQ